ncbi:hypothetical protein L228DRAFT_285006 [Xylona heveae TC161]|uniref:Membrane insertase YidC/Oxa/ALB C-terminal domain-containing protein n=1 Tax=Xylona heveae (strain CBS 132557 / TC161) TaxID=1328760 RepID=A0A165AD47_XYLHT|nr:hypothetical protein L228DRAFT_285006 [Xylona heveae TC161]KZF20281.1 hypothetical protein L228DRAFT_285006 [Xylona heveae TC161]
MIPSRGLQTSSRTVTASFSRLVSSVGPSRQFSSGPASIFNGRINVSRGLSGTYCAPWAALRSKSALPIASSRSIRHNTTAAGSHAQGTSDGFVTSSLDAASDLSTGSLSSVTPHIGYFKELGLDYGWGPTSMVQWALEHIHVYCGTPWWASLLLVTAGLRLAMLKPTIAAAVTSARLAIISPVTQPIRDKMMAASKLKNNTEMIMTRNELMQIHKRANIQTWKAFLPMLQVPFGYGIFRLTRGMASLPVPGFENGGFAWITDLTLHDPLFLLPIGTAAAVYFSLKRGVETNSMMSPAVHKVLTTVFPLMAGGFMVYWPAALQLSFFFSSVFGLLQAFLLKNPTFRAMVGIPPTPPPQSGSTPGPASTSPIGPKSPLAGRITISPNYQPPTAQSTIAAASEAADAKSEQPKEKKNFINSTISDVKGMSNEMMKSARKYMGTEASAPGERSVVEKRQNKAYEERRRREIESENQDLEDERRARWHQRKLEQQERRLRQSDRDQNKSA